jgi:hypothetical protein
MDWMRSVCGRMKSDYQYSAGIVYNNFVWPDEVSESAKKRVTECAEHVLAVRKEFSDANLATLYNNLTTPPKLTKAHEELDKAVDKAYGYKGSGDDASRVAYLFRLYEELTSLLAGAVVKKVMRKKVTV